jgi:pyruvate dehydrogenase E2 component (dihydrolipoamide acetyltransferase)
MTALIRFREELTHANAPHSKPTFTHVLIQACARTLKSSPDMNVRYEGFGDVVHLDRVTIGLAVSLDPGIGTISIPDADLLSLGEISRLARDKITRIRSREAIPADTVDKSLVISNLGSSLDIVAFSALLEAPCPLILAVGRIADRVVPQNGAPIVRPECTLTLTADHRVFDGLPAARFLTDIKRALESVELARVEARAN